jgi:hypothetical protein
MSRGRTLKFPMLVSLIGHICRLRNPVLSGFTGQWYWFLVLFGGQWFLQKEKPSF